MSTRVTSRRSNHKRENSLSAFDEQYVSRNIRYEASPTPQTSATKHHRRNSLKRKQLQLQSRSFVAAPMNIKFTDKSMVKRDGPDPVAKGVAEPKYVINATQHDPSPGPNTKTTTIRLHSIQSTDPPPPSTSTSRERELKERALRLSIKETKVDELQSKNVTFIQSLQKQIESLSRQLHAERHRATKHRVRANLSALSLLSLSLSLCLSHFRTLTDYVHRGQLSKDELAELDAVKRENSALQATLKRMGDEMKWMEVEPRSTVSVRRQKVDSRSSPNHTPNGTATGTTLNNYYINAISLVTE